MACVALHNLIGKHYRSDKFSVEDPGDNAKNMKANNARDDFEKLILFFFKKRVKTWKDETTYNSIILSYKADFNLFICKNMIIIFYYWFIITMNSIKIRYKMNILQPNLFFLNTCIIISKETWSQNIKETGERKQRIQRKLLEQIFQPKRGTPCYVGMKLIFLDNTISNSEGCSKGLSWLSFYSPTQKIVKHRR